MTAEEKLFENLERIIWFDKYSRIKFDEIKHNYLKAISEHSTKEQVINFALEAITRRDELVETADTKPVFEYENKWLTIDELYCEFFETPVKK